MSKRKKLIGLIVLLMALIALAFIIRPKDSEPDLSLLNHEVFIKILATSDSVEVLSEAEGSYSIKPSGQFVSTFRSSEWTQKRMGAIESIPQLRILIRDDYFMNLYLEDELVQVYSEVNDEKYRFYKVPKEVIRGIEKYVVDAGEKMRKESISREVEVLIAEILSNEPQYESDTTFQPPGALSSNPYDYIKAGQDSFEDLLKLGDDAVEYMLSEIKDGDSGLREWIMMEAAKEILGPSISYRDDASTVSEWYKSIKIEKEISIKDFEYFGNESIEALVYTCTINEYSKMSKGFTVVASKIFGSYEEGNLLKVFATSHYESYMLYGETLELDSGGIVPVAMTFDKNGDDYYLVEYKEALDGGLWKKSIEDFCIMPVSKDVIPGLANEIVSHYSNRDDLRDLQREHLHQTLVASGIERAYLYDSKGNVLFSMEEF